MEEVRIKLLSLLNFKGLKSFEISDFNGGISIYGDNASGKTTIFDAFCWVLFDKDSLNSAVFDIKALTPSGEPLHGLEHDVECVLIHKGQEISLRKVYAEKYTKRRGTAKQEFTGHTVDHYVNGVPCKKKEFTAVVNEICNEENFKLLTNPRYFNEILHWTDRRRLLLDVCGDVSDADVVTTDPQLQRLPEILGKNSIDNQKKMIKSRQTDINDQLKKIPPRIDERHKSKVEVVNTKEEVIAQYELYKSRKITAESSLAQIKAGGGIVEKEKNLAEAETKIMVHRNQVAGVDIERKRSQAKELQENEDVAIKAARATEDAVIAQSKMIKNKAELIEQAAGFTKKRDALRKKWIAADAEKFVPVAGENSCPTCGQKLPAEKVEEAARLAVEAFNLAKAQKVAKIAEEGRGFKDRLDVLEQNTKTVAAEIIKADSQIKRLADTQDRAQEIVDNLKAHHEKINIAIPPDVILDDLMAAKDIIELDINGLRAGNSEAVLAAQGEIDRIVDMISIVTADKIHHTNNEADDRRIFELEQEERDLAMEYEKLEQELFIIESFIRKKVSMLERKIKKKFKLASFQMFINNISGGLEECCNTTFKGVPYASMNNAARINVGLDICNTLSKHYGISLPCFIDNAEAITRLLQTGAQQVRLFVSKDDEKLRIEK